MPQRGSTSAPTEWKEPHSTQIRKKPRVNDREAVLGVLHSCCPTWRGIKRTVGEVPPPKPTHPPCTSSSFGLMLFCYSDQNTGSRGFRGKSSKSVTIKEYSTMCSCVGKLLNLAKNYWLTSNQKPRMLEIVEREAEGQVCHSTCEGNRWVPRAAIHTRKRSREG